jgi:hypothetical protein
MEEEIFSESAEEEDECSDEKDAKKPRRSASNFGVYNPTLEYDRNGTSGDTKKVLIVDAFNSLDVPTHPLSSGESLSRTKTDEFNKNNLFDIAKPVFVRISPFTFRRICVKFLELKKETAKAKSLLRDTKRFLKRNLAYLRSYLKRFFSIYETDVDKINSDASAIDRYCWYARLSIVSEDALFSLKYISKRTKTKERILSKLCVESVQCEKMLEKLIDLPRDDVVFSITSLLNDFCHIALLEEIEEEEEDDHVQKLFERMRIEDRGETSSFHAKTRGRQEASDFPAGNPVEFVRSFFDVITEPETLWKRITQDQFLGVDFFQENVASSFFPSQKMSKDWKWDWSFTTIETSFLLPVSLLTNDCEDPKNDEFACMEQIKSLFEFSFDENKSYGSRTENLRRRELEISFWNQLGDFYESPPFGAFENLVAYGGRSENVTSLLSLEKCITLPHYVFKNSPLTQRKTQFCRKTFFNVAGKMLDSSFAIWLYYAYIFQKYKPKPPSSEEEQDKSRILDYPGAHVLCDPRVMMETLEKISASYELAPFLKFKRRRIAEFDAWVLFFSLFEDNEGTKPRVRWIKCRIDPVACTATFYSRSPESSSFCVPRKAVKDADRRKKTSSFKERDFYFECKSNVTAITIPIYDNTPLFEVSFNNYPDAECDTEADRSSCRAGPSTPPHLFLKRHLSDEIKNHLVTDPTNQIAAADRKTAGVDRKKMRFRKRTENRMHNTLINHSYGHGITYLSTFGSIFYDVASLSGEDDFNSNQSSLFVGWYRSLPDHAEKVEYGTVTVKENQKLYMPPMTELKDGVRAYPYDNSPQTHSFFETSGCREFYGWETVSSFSGDGSPDMLPEDVEIWKKKCGRELVNAALPSRYVKFNDRELIRQTVKCGNFETLCETAKARFESRLVCLVKRVNDSAETEGRTGETLDISKLMFLGGGESVAAAAATTETTEEIVCEPPSEEGILLFSKYRRCKRPLPPVVFCDNLLPKNPARKDFDPREGECDSHRPFLFFRQSWNRESWHPNETNQRANLASDEILKTPNGKDRDDKDATPIKDVHLSVPFMRFARRKVRDVSQYYKPNKEISCLNGDFNVNLTGSDLIEKTNVVDVALLSLFDILCTGMDQRMKNAVFQKPNSTVRGDEIKTSQASLVAKDLASGTFLDFLIRANVDDDDDERIPGKAVPALPNKKSVRRVVSFFSQLENAFFLENGREGPSYRFLTEVAVQIRDGVPEPERNAKSESRRPASFIDLCGDGDDDTDASIKEKLNKGLEKKREEEKGENSGFYFPILYDRDQEESAQRVLRLDGRKIRRSYFVWGDPKHRSTLVENSDPWAFSGSGGTVLYKSTSPRADSEEDEDTKHFQSEYGGSISAKESGETTTTTAPADSSWVPGIKGPILDCKNAHLVDRIRFSEMTACAVNSLALKYLQKYQAACKRVLVTKYANSASSFMEKLYYRLSRLDLFCKSNAGFMESADTDEDLKFERSKAFVRLMYKKCKSIEEWDGETVEYDDHSHCLGLKTALFEEYARDPVKNQTSCKRLAYALGLLHPPDVASLRLEKGSCEKETGEMYSELETSQDLVRLMDGIECDPSDHQKLGDDRRPNGHCLSCAIKKSCKSLFSPRKKYDDDDTSEFSNLPFAKESDYVVTSKTPSSPLEKYKKAYSASHVCIYNHKTITNNIAIMDLLLKHLLKSCAFQHFSNLEEEDFLSRLEISNSSRFQSDPFARFEV